MTSKNKKKILISLLLIVSLALTVSVPISQGASIADKFLKRFRHTEPSVPLMPPGVKVKSGFARGKGDLVGKVTKTVGRIYVIHQAENVAYRLRKKLDVFTGDTFISDKRSRLYVSMKDQSLIAMAPDSKLTIDKSVYDPGKNTRSSIMRILFGRVRFLVKKISVKSQFVVMTQTAIIGVRGSDFGVSVIPVEDDTSSGKNILDRLNLVKKAWAAQSGEMVTSVVTGPATTIGFAGKVGSEVTVGPSSVSETKSGQQATDPVNVGDTLAEEMLNEIAVIDFTSPSNLIFPIVLDDDDDDDDDGNGNRDDNDEDGGIPPFGSKGADDDDDDDDDEGTPLADSPDVDVDVDVNVDASVDGPDGPCFAAGTLVLMEDGSGKQIEKIRSGDRVMAYNIKTGKKVVGTVSGLKNGTGDHFFFVNDHIKVTPPHPFYTEKNQWVKIKDLNVGEAVRISSSFSDIKSIRRVEKSQKIFNIRVKGYRNFYVSGDGKEYFLVNEGD